MRFEKPPRQLCPANGAGLELLRDLREVIGLGIHPLCLERLDLCERSFYRSIAAGECVFRGGVGALQLQQSLQRLKTLLEQRLHHFDLAAYQRQLF